MRDDGEKPDGDYKVGYCRPPKHTRFKPGQSGNPRGRGRKSKALHQLIEAELDKFITVTEDGKRKRIRKRDGLVTQLVNRGIKGDPKSLQLLISHLEKHCEVEP